MELKKGRTIFDADGEKVGDISRVVLDPQTLDVSHVVVEKGFLFKEDHVVPAAAIKFSDDDGAYLDPTATADDFPPFEERTYLGFDPVSRGYAPAAEAPAMIFFPPVGSWGVPEYVGERTNVPAVVRNIPEGSVALEPGAEVRSADGEKLGDVAEVLTAGDTGHTTHLVIEEGMFFKHRKTIPMTWVASLTDDHVRLAVNADVVERVPEQS